MTYADVMRPPISSAPMVPLRFNEGSGVPGGSNPIPDMVEFEVKVTVDGRRCFARPYLCFLRTLGGQWRMEKSQGIKSSSIWSDAVEWVIAGGPKVTCRAVVTDYSWYSWCVSTSWTSYVWLSSVHKRPSLYLSPRPSSSIIDRWW